MNNDGYRKERLDFKRFTLSLQKKIWLVLLLCIVGAGIGALSYQVVRALHMPVEYEATSKLYIQFNADETGQVYQYYNGYTWNELLDSEPIMECIMGYLIGYDQDEVRAATSADILSDIRLLTVTIKGSNEKFVREVQSAVENGLTIYATLSPELRSVATIRTIAPDRVYWTDYTFRSALLGGIIFGIITFFVFCILYIMDDGIYVQTDIEKRFEYKSLGTMCKNQKGLQPYLKELRANLYHVLEEKRSLVFIDTDEHAPLRAQDFERILNWQEGGALDGVSDAVGELVWHVKEEDEDEDLFQNDEIKEWTIVPLNSQNISDNECELIRNAGGVVILVPFGQQAAPRKLERVLSLMKTQDINVYGLVISEADEEYLNRYYS